MGDEAGARSTIAVVRAFLAVEAITFGAAALVHRGILVEGYRHREAFIAETVIASVLLAGLLASWLVRRRARIAGLAAQAFALLGTMIGLFTMAIGVGPRTVPDLVYHVLIVVVLIRGLVVTARARPAGTPEA
jgi:hypothetical protein